MIFKWLLSANGSLIQIMWYALIIVSLWIIEVIISIEEPIDKWRHSRLNFSFIFTALSIQLLLTPIMLGTAQWVCAHHWGLSELLPYHDHWGVQIIGSFILLDFFEYVYHVIMHKTKALWKLHLVHHSDRVLDVSTTVREHPAETFIRLCFTTIWVFLTGASIGSLVLRQFFQTASNLIAHSTVKLPEKLERIFSYVLITPEMHRVHHHFELPHTDSNYGDVFSIWDRMFGTFRKRGLTELVYGIDTHFEGATEVTFKELLKVPFSGVGLPAAADKLAVGDVREA